MSQTNDNPMDRAPEGVTAPARPSEPAACYVDTRTPEERAHDAAHPPALTTYPSAPRESEAMVRSDAPALRAQQRLNALRDDVAELAELTFHTTTIAQQAQRRGLVNLIQRLRGIPPAERLGAEATP